MTTFGDTHEYAMWDAAYVLGSLSSSDRREYEAHLATCAACRDAVGQLSGMPALLALLSADEVKALDQDTARAAETAPPPQLLPSLLAKVSWRRRRSRVLTWTTLPVAAAMLTIGLLFALPAATPTPTAQATVLMMAPVKPSDLSSTVTLTTHNWGTRIDMGCVYEPLAPGANENSDEQAGDKLAMVVVGRDGTETQLATWVALTGVPATPGGSTSMPLREIAAVQIVSADSGDVLLERQL
jgi:hypothetical protein